MDFTDIPNEFPVSSIDFIEIPLDFPSIFEDLPGNLEDNTGIPVDFSCHFCKFSLAFYFILPVFHCIMEFLWRIPYHSDVFSQHYCKFPRYSS